MPFDKLDQKLSPSVPMMVLRSAPSVLPFSNAHELPMSQSTVDPNLLVNSEALKLSQPVDVTTKILPPILESEQILNVDPILSAKTTSEAQTKLKVQPVFENQHISEIQPKPVQQLLHGNNLHLESQSVPVSLTHQMQVSKLMPVIKSDVQPTNLVHPTQKAQHMPSVQPMAVFQTISETQPSVVQTTSVAQHLQENQDNKSTLLTQQISLDQKVSKRSSMPAQKTKQIPLTETSAANDKFSKSQFSLPVVQLFLKGKQIPDDNSISIAQQKPKEQSVSEELTISKTKATKTKRLHNTQFPRQNQFRKPQRFRKQTKYNPQTVNSRSKQMTQLSKNLMPRIDFCLKIKIKRKVWIFIIGTLLLLFGIWAIWRWRLTYNIDLPPISCPKYFQYQSQDRQFIGKIKLSDLSSEIIQVDLIMQQLRPIDNDYVGNLTLYEDRDTTEKNWMNDKTITYRVTFPCKNELPKLISLSVNGKQICSGIKYPNSGSEFALSHTFFLSKNPISKTLRRPLTENSTDINQTIKKHVTHPTKLTEIPSVESRFLPPLASSECGRLYDGTTPLIFGGKELLRGQFPWLVAIYRKHYTGLQFICGGSLISSRTVITAGHCFKLYNLRQERVVVFLGRHNLEIYGEDFVVLREIDKLLIHADYNDRKFPDADLALLQMQSPVRFSEYIQPICLWSGPEHVSAIINQTGVVAGWGADENGRIISAIPKWVESDIVSEVDCLHSSDVFRLLTSKRTICAGNRDGTGPCMGDSGGGLMIKRDGRWMIRGIVSAGQIKHQTCNLHEFVVYCDLAKHMAWIKSNLL